MIRWTTIPAIVSTIIIVVDPVVLLATVIAGEAQCDGILGSEAMLWVAHTVMNRVKSDLPYYPNTIVEVIEADNGFYGRKEPNAFHIYLARKVIRRDHDITSGALSVLSEQDRIKLGKSDGYKVFGRGDIKLHFYKE